MPKQATDGEANKMYESQKKHAELSANTHLEES